MTRHTQLKPAFMSRKPAANLGRYAVHIAPVPVIERYAELGEDGIVVPGLPQHVESMKRFRKLPVSAVYPATVQSFPTRMLW